MKTNNGFELRVEESGLEKILSTKKMGELFGYRVNVSSTPKCVNGNLYIWDNGKMWVVAGAIFKGKRFYYYNIIAETGTLETAFSIAGEYLLNTSKKNLEGS